MASRPATNAIFFDFPHDDEAFKRLSLEGPLSGSYVRFCHWVCKLARQVRDRLRTAHEQLSDDDDGSNTFVDLRLLGDRLSDALRDVELLLYSVEETVDYPRGHRLPDGVENAGEISSIKEEPHDAIVKEEKLDDNHPVAESTIISPNLSGVQNNSLVDESERFPPGEDTLPNFPFHDAFSDDEDDGAENTVSSPATTNAIPPSRPRDDYYTGIFKCLECGAKYKHRASLSRHRKYEHKITKKTKKIAKKLKDAKAMTNGVIKDAALVAATAGEEAKYESKGVKENVLVDDYREISPSSPSIPMQSTVEPFTSSVVTLSNDARSTQDSVSRPSLRCDHCGLGFEGKAALDRHLLDVMHENAKMTEVRVAEAEAKRHNSGTIVEAISAARVGAKRAVDGGRDVLHV